MKTSKPGRSKRRKINKALDQRFALRNQRATMLSESHRGKSLMDIADTPRRPRQNHGLRRTQMGRSLLQSELASRDPVREGS